MGQVDSVQLLQQLVRIPSVNPMGRPVSSEPSAEGPEPGESAGMFSEGRLTDFLEQFCRRFGLEVFRQPVLPGRENLILRLPGHPPPEQGGQILLWDAHQDTVPPGQMPNPFDAQLRQGRLYGRGACDVKGGLAAMLAALVRLASESVSGQSGSASSGTAPARRPTVYLAATVDEEHGMSGVRAVQQLWQAGGGEIFPRRPDAAVVAEPTQLQVVVAHKGVMRWRCHTRGQACHSSQPREGVNAIYLMAEVLQALQEYAAMVPQLGWHPLCGHPSLSVGRIYGGQSVNIVPDRCTIEIDRRLLPDESPQQAWEHCLRYLLGCFTQPDRLEQEPPWPPIPGLSDQANSELAAKLSGLVTEVTGKDCQRIGVPYTTNAGFYTQAGVPTVVFGPGSIQQAHTSDEWIALDQVEQAAQVFYRLVTSWYLAS